MLARCASLLLLAACSSAPSARPELDHALVDACDPADFPGAAALLSGFDAPADVRDFRIGDSALFALEVHTHEAVERRLLRLRVSALTGHLRSAGGDTPFDLKLTKKATVTLTLADGRQDRHSIDLTPIAVELTQYDASGALQRTSTVELYEELLAVGLRPMPFVGTDPARAGEAFLLLHTLEQLGGSDPVLAEQLFAIVDRPSVLSVVLHFGVAISLRIEEQLPWRGALVMPACRDPIALPLAVQVNGAPVLFADLLVARSQHPIAIGGGVLAAVARHATDPSRHAVLRLLAARRAPATPAR
jgi:hypothetical protein